MHVRSPDGLSEDVFRQVLELLAEFSPVVQALPPSAALVELKGALRYHGTGARRLGEVLRIRTLSRLGVDVRVGIGLHSCTRRSPCRRRARRVWERAPAQRLAGPCPAGVCAACCRAGDLRQN